jgi:protein SCO1
MMTRPLLATLLTACLAFVPGCDKAPSLNTGNRVSAPQTIKPSVPGVSFNAVDITGADYGRQLSLPDVEGKTRDLHEFKGKVAVVFFGFTQCPDVCPITMAELAQVKKELGPQGAQLQGIFVSLDPERDTPERLKNYVTAFDSSFIALRGTVAQTAIAAREFKVFFAKVQGKTEGSYSLDHTAGSFIFDAAGRLRLFARYSPGGGNVATLKSDLLQLLDKG